MYVRMLAGRNAGKDVYTPPHIGKILLADGRAEHPNAIPAPVAEIVPVPTPEEVPAVAPAALPAAPVPVTPPSAKVKVSKHFSRKSAR